jgi:DNA replication protein DnaC
MIPAATRRIEAVDDQLSTTQSISNYKTFDFFDTKFDHSFIQKFVQNITSFVVA